MPYVNTIERVEREKAVHEGEVKGEAKLLKRLVLSKYGRCPERAQSKLNAADSEQLESWAERIFHAESLEDLLSD